MTTGCGSPSFLSRSTAVFICTSPIKKYKYCPYEKVRRAASLEQPGALPLSPLPHGSQVRGAGSRHAQRKGHGLS